MTIKPSYWAVIWSDKEKDEDGRGNPLSGPARFPESLRVASGKYTDPKLACRETFGTVSPNMWVKNLGTRITVMHIDRERRAALNPDNGRWVRLGNESTFQRSTGQVLWVDGKVAKEENK